MLDIEYLPVHFALFLIIGIVTGFYIDIGTLPIFIIIIVLFVCLIYRYLKSINSFQPSFSYTILTGFIFFVFGILIINAQKPQNQKGHYIHLIASENQISFQIRKILKSNNYYDKYEAEVLQINSFNTYGKVLINVKKDSLKRELKTDDILFTNNEFKEIRKSLNPHEFDYRDYLKKQQIYFQFILNSRDYLIVSDQRTLLGIAHNLREKIQKEFENVNFSKNELSIVKALLLGQRQDISKEQFNQYKNAGVIHILAVSGLHMGIILLFLNFLFKPIEYVKKGKILKLILVLICLWFYAFLAGLSPSIIRSVTMFTAIAIGLVSNRRFGIQNSLVISVFILLIVHPQYLFNVGFQLSYTAVFSIIWLQPLFANNWKPKPIILKYFWSLITVTFAAQIGVLPLSLFYFHQFPGLFFISSIVIIPFLGFILGVGFLIIILGVLYFIPQPLAEFYEFLIRTMNDFVAFISNQEIFIFENISFSVITMILFYALLIGIVLWINNKSIYYLRFVLIVAFIFQVSLIYKKYTVQNTNEFVVFHQSNKSVFGNRQGSQISIFQNLDTLDKYTYSPFSSYLLYHSNLNFQKKLSVKNIYTINSKNILTIDRSGIYKDLKFNPNMIILINSPKINLERMLNILQPEIVIADGSNYNSYVKLWRETCKSKSIAFYSTQKNGAFVYRY